MEVRVGIRPVTKEIVWVEPPEARCLVTLVGGEFLLLAHAAHVSQTSDVPPKLSCNCITYTVEEV